MRYALPIFLSVSLLILSGCGTTRHTASHPKPTPVPVATEPVKPLPDAPALTIRLLDQANSWLGVPYRYGGDTEQGVDCSGLTCRVMEHTAGIKLPRSSAEQQQWCQPIDSAAAVTGDLMFFSSSGSDVSHVGIYVGNRRMIHASASRGVVVDPIDSPYFLRTYHSTGRVSALFAATPPAPPEPVIPMTVKVAADTTVTNIPKPTYLPPSQPLTPDEARRRVLNLIQNSDTVTPHQ